MLVAAMYLLMWGLAMGTAAAGLWPLAVATALVMGGLCFRREIVRLHRRARG